MRELIGRPSTPAADEAVQAMNTSALAQYPYALVAQSVVVTQFVGADGRVFYDLVSPNGMPGNAALDVVRDLLAATEREARS